MLYEGSTVAAGRATAVVVETGSATETGRALAALSGAAPVTGVREGGEGEVRMDLELHPLLRAGIHDPHPLVGARRGDHPDTTLHRAQQAAATGVIGVLPQELDPARDVVLALGSRNAGKRPQRRSRPLGQIA